MFERAKAAVLLRSKIGELARYVGVTGGDYVFRDSEGRVWAVDLVTRTSVVCVGLMPSQWRHPPR